MARKVTEEDFNQRAHRIVQQATKEDALPQLLDTDLEALDVPQKSLFVLRRIGLQTFRDLTQKSRADLERVPNFSKRAITEVEDAFAKHGLTLRP